MRATPTSPSPRIHVAQYIVTLRDQRVMLDAELAALYGVETKVLVQAIKRNIERFPADFMFQLCAEELANLRSQFVTSNREPSDLRLALDARGEAEPRRGSWAACLNATRALQ